MDNKLIHMENQSVLPHKETGLVITTLRMRSQKNPCCFSRVWFIVMVIEFWEKTIRF